MSTTGFDVLSHKLDMLAVKLDEHISATDVREELRLIRKQRLGPGFIIFWMGFVPFMCVMIGFLLLMANGNLV